MSARGRGGRVLVLAYHAIADLSDDERLAEYGMPPEDFARQLDGLIARGRSFIGLGELIDALEAGAALPRKPALLTFDDAYADLREAALPILAERGIPAAVFAVSGQIGGTNRWAHRERSSERPLLDAGSLRAVAAAGIEVGAHSVSHRFLPELTDEELRAEVRESADAIEAAGLPRPRAFAYPYGGFDERVAAAVRDAGYRLAFTIDTGLVQPGADRFALPRVQVLASDRGWPFGLRCAAAGWRPRARHTVERLVGAMRR